MPFINLNVNNTDASLVETPADKIASIFQLNVCNSGSSPVIVSTYLSTPSRVNVLNGITLGAHETLIIEDQMVPASENFFINVAGGNADVTGFYNLSPLQ